MSLLYPKDYSYKVELHEPESCATNQRYQIVFTCNGGKFGTDEGIAEYELTALELLERLQAEPARWIPFSERTPPTDVLVWVYPEYECSDTNKWTGANWYYYTPTPPTHWMPIPELPKPTQP